MAMTIQQMKAQYPDPMRQGLVSLLWEHGVILRHLNFIQNAGLSYTYAATAKLPGVGFRSINEDFTATEGVTNPKSEALVVMGGKIRTDSIITTIKGDGARTDRIAKQMEAAAKFFNKSFFQGDPTTDPKAFYGLKKRISAGQTVTNSANGATIDGNKVIAAQAKVNGANGQKVLCTNQTNIVNLVAWAMDSTALNRGRYIEYVGTGPDRQLYFNGSLVQQIDKDEAEAEILGFTETCGSSNVCSSLYVCKFGGATDESDIQGLSGIPSDIQHKGPIDYGTYMEDVVQMLAGIGLFSGYCAARVEGCTA